MDEHQWIHAIQKGDKRYLEDIAEKYYDDIFRFCAFQTGSREDAMDLTQNIFLAVLRALPAFDRKKAGFRTWLYRIAANKAVDARRRAGPATVPIDELVLPAAEDFAMAVQDRELLERIESYVSGLDPGIQAVFRLRLYGEKSFPEIAAILDQSESAVKSQYYRLLGRLRKEFDPNG